MSDIHGEIHWTELMTRDVDAAKAYYTETCGWQWQTMPMEEGAEYHVAMRGDQMVAGAMDMTAMPGLEETPPHWFTYLAVDDVDAATARTAELGGQIIRPCFDVAGVGRIAIVTDPSGAAIGLMTPSDAG